VRDWHVDQNLGHEVGLGFDIISSLAYYIFHQNMCVCGLNSLEGFSDRLHSSLTEGLLHANYPSALTYENLPSLKE